MPKNLLILSLLALAVGCGGSIQNFSPLMVDNRASDIEDIRQRIASSTPPTPNVAVGIAGETLFAFNLDSGQKLWETPTVSPSAAPQIAGDYVVVPERDGIVIRALASGTVTDRVDDETLLFAGAAGEGEYGVLCLTTSGGVGSRSRIIMLRGGHAGSDRGFEDTTLGAPAAAGGRLFIPWSTQNVSVLDPRSGAELSRFRQNTAIIGHVVVRDQQLYFGQRGLFRLTPEVATSEGAPYYELPERDLPGAPTFLLDPYNPPPAPDSAVHRVRAVFHPGGQGNIMAPADDVVYLVFFGTVFGLHPTQDEVLFATMLPADAVGVEARPGGLLVADATGAVHFLDARDGRVRSTVNTGVAEPTVVTFRAETFTSRGAPSEAARPLTEQLLTIAQSADSRIVPAREFAVRMLKQMPGAEATGHLVTMCDDPRTTAAIKRLSCAALAERTEGGEHVTRALQRHGGYLEQTEPPALIPLAQAAARMELTSAVPLLLSHVRDPQTPANALPELFKSLKVLADASAAAPVRDFLRLYHADGDPALLEALSHAADTLATLEGPTSRETLTEIIEDTLTPNDVRNVVRDALESLDQAQEGEAGEAAEDS